MKLHIVFWCLSLGLLASLQTVYSSEKMMDLDNVEPSRLMVALDLAVPVQDALSRCVYDGDEVLADDQPSYTVMTSSSDDDPTIDLKTLLGTDGS